MGGTGGGLQMCSNFTSRWDSKCFNNAGFISSAPEVSRHRPQTKKMKILLNLKYCYIEGTHEFTFYLQNTRNQITFFNYCGNKCPLLLDHVVIKLHDHAKYPFLTTL